MGISINFGSTEPRRARRLSTSSSIVVPKTTHQAPKRYINEKPVPKTPRTPRAHFSWPKWRLPPVISTLRLFIYGAVFLWSIVCLAIAVHFQSVLVSSDLTHFVPFAIFVSCASMVLVIILLGATFLRHRNPVSTRIELIGLALIGTLWLALGVFLSISKSADADVECFSSDSSETDPVDFPGFSTETYHAQYHVLQAFSIFNIILVWGFMVLILLLSLRQHRLGNSKIWTYPITVNNWFGKPHNQPSKYAPKAGLPAPVTARPSQRRGSTRRQGTQTSPEESLWVWVEKPKDPPQAHTREQRRHHDNHRTNSSRRH